MMADFATSVPFLRPLSAKKKPWFQPFSSVVSCSRLRRVQRLLRGCNNPQAKINGILCILGIDSRFNGGARRLMNYLLFGFCELTPADVSNTQISDEELEDVVIFVKAESVHVYCNPVNYSFLLPLIAQWRNLRIHCLSEEEYRDNEEKAEDFKITSFISMVKGSECIGIPYSDGTVGEQGPTFEPFSLEKWPLVQAYALEGFGSGGFFTMNHEVLDVSEHLNVVYGLLDPVGIETLATQILPLFEHHCKSVLINVDLKSSNTLSKLTERSLSEPIVSYFNHGHISETDNGKSSSANCQPFVLLGCNSSRNQLKNLQKLLSYNSNSTLTNSGIDGSPARHLVCFAAEPRGVITCARTYFLENCYIPCSLQEAAKESPSVSSSDVRLLMDLYLLSIRAVVEAMKTFSQTFSQQQSESTVLSQLKLGIQEKKIELDPHFLSSNMEFTIEACDYLGRNVALQEGKPLGVIKKVCLYIYDVPSVEHLGKSLGSIIFGESFQDSGIRSLIPDSPSVWNSSFVCLTENIPRFVSWLGSGEEKQASTELQTFAKSNTEENWLGRKLLFGNEVFILSSVNGWEEGSLFIYEQGFLFIHPRIGCVLLPIAKLAQIHFYDGDSTSVTALLMLTCYADLQRKLPFHFLGENNTVVLALTRRSRVYTMFYSDVLHLWKDKQLPNLPPFEVVTDLPDRLLRMHVLLYQQLKQSSKRDIYSLSSAEAFLPSLKGFLSHFAVSSSLGDTPVKSDDLPVLLGNNLLEQDQPQDFELLLTVLTGVPGSGKEALCLALVALAKEDSKWMILQRPVNQAEPFDPKVLQNSLTNVLTSQRRLHARMSANRRLRVLIVTPGFTDVIDVIQAITMHPDHEVAKSLKIGAVTCCIDPLNTFMENRLTLPKLLEQCAQGWVNNVVFTSCLEPQNEQLSLIQNLVRASNPDVACILGKNGEVTRTPDVELILSDSGFDEGKTFQKRHLMCPGWSLGLFSSGPPEPLITEICVPFYGPLDRTRFISNLKAMQGPISEKGIVKYGAIHSLQGQICFSEGDTRREVHIHWARLSGALKISTVDSSAVPRPPPSKAHSNGIVEDVPRYFIVFTGFHLQEQNLKDWLTTCCKPAPVKQKFKVRNDLSDEEIKDISGKHKFDPLPPGWFYNGSHYVSLVGDKHTNHPLLGTFIEAYLHEINEDIKQYNATVDSQPSVVDIFEKPGSSS